MRIEDKTRLDSLKIAAIVMGKLADSFQEEEIRNHTQSLAWTISWAVIELTHLLEKKDKET